MILQSMLIVSMILFSLGVYGVIAKRDLLRIVLSVTVILGSITLLAATLAKFQATPEAAATMYTIVLFAWAVEVVEVLIALSLFLVLAKKGITDITTLEQLKW